ncbi:hypothetical protein QI334_03280 [Staphylococcus saprophyticus]|uniref:hypothetical protein n=1 Tax=Staphylococcus saprophyticus TaxID=29385 RepID=UPI00157E019B|nr:hypothetical protein [Staphylococcus saprophyticus]MDW3861875.1 hypothetical protein [Staphylococcus saprophyticus]MDW3914139.1 hypothetical protein [Staphylococcus saprophyticus]MDW3924116.1 hypothetical protein [Staphylococcus saprophyticus]MDW3961912.1 hypothetical protein [Staphylococcus saprophyticus]MDW3974321.1 hypothetical protein [Staphylococcus saprophyticus]
MKLGWWVQMEYDSKQEMLETLQVLLNGCKTFKNSEVIKVTAKLLEAWSNFLTII